MGAATRKLPKQELRRYSRETPFTQGEVKTLWARFSAMDADSSGMLNLQELMRVHELRCNPFAARILALFSEDGRGRLDFQKFVNMMSVFSSRASRETKTVWAFALWDFDGDDLIGPRDIRKGLHMLSNASVSELEEQVSGEDEDIESAGASEGSGRSADAKRREKRRGSKDTDLLSTDQMNQVLERIGEEIDPEGTGLSYGDFEGIVGRMPDFISNFRMAV